MDVISRNLLRLLRIGITKRQEPLEPLADWRWRELLNRAEGLHVADRTYDGIILSQDQFFVCRDYQTLSLWKQLAYTASATSTETQAPQHPHLSNPLLRRRFESIMSTADSPSQAQALLARLVDISETMLTSGLPLRKMVELCSVVTALHASDAPPCAAQISEWADKLCMGTMARAIGSFLTTYLGLPADQQLLPAEDGQLSHRLAEAIDSSLPGGACRTSARYFRFFPTEAATTFVSGFADMLSQVEE